MFRLIEAKTWIHTKLYYRAGAFGLAVIAAGAPAWIGRKRSVGDEDQMLPQVRICRLFNLLYRNS